MPLAFLEKEIYPVPQGSIGLVIADLRALFYGYFLHGLGFRGEIRVYLIIQRLGQRAKIPALNSGALLAPLTFAAIFENGI